MLKTLSTTQAAEYFGVHIKTIFRWINNSKLSAEKVNGQWHVQINEPDAQNDVQNVQDNARNNVQTDTHERLIAQQQAEIDHLRDQLSRRDEQLDHLTQLLALKEKNVAALTEQLDSSRQMIEDMRHRRTVWQRIKGVFVATS